MKHLFKYIVVIVILLTISETKVEAKEDINTKIMDLSRLQYINEEGTIKVEEEKKGEKKISFDTKGLKEGVYTSFLYFRYPTKIREMSGLSFTLQTKDSITMNLTLITDTNKSIMLKDTKPIYLDYFNEAIDKMILIENGTFIIPANFKGVITIPFTSFKTQEASSKIQSFGITLVQNENEIKEMKIKDLKILSKEDFKSTYNTKVKVTGENFIEIPTKGEFLYEYSVKNNKYRFHLNKSAAGIELSESGVLRVLDSAKPQKLKMIVTVDDVLQYEYPIEIILPWFQSIDMETINFAVPDHAEVNNYAGMFLSDYKMDKVIKVACILGVLFYSIFYIKRIRRYNKRNKS